MYLFGCLPLLLLIFAVAIVLQLLNFAGRTLETIGATTVWLWESFLNIFRSEKKEVINPFSGESNFDNARQDKDIKYTPTEQRPKRYDPKDGEVVDFTEVNNND